MEHEITSNNDGEGRCAGAGAPLTLQFLLCLPKLLQLREVLVKDEHLGEAERGHGGRRALITLRGRAAPGDCGDHSRARQPRYWRARPASLPSPVPRPAPAAPPPPSCKWMSWTFGKRPRYYQKEALYHSYELTLPTVLNHKFYMWNVT